MGTIDVGAKPLKSFRTVPRARLTSMLEESLRRGGMVCISAESGLGKSVTSGSALVRMRASGCKVFSFRFSRVSHESSCRRLRKLMKEAIGYLDDDKLPIVIMEDVPLVSDPYFHRIQACLEALAVSGCGVLLTMHPSAEPILDSLPNLRILRSGDLLVRHDELDYWRDFIGPYGSDKVYTLARGIPSLVCRLRDLTFDVHGEPASSWWNDCIREVLKSALSNHYIDEEIKFKCAMVALGNGRIEELLQLGVDPRRDLIKDCEENSPFFGINLSSGTFSIAACRIDAVAQVLLEHCSKWPWIITRSMEHLADRGDFYRAGVIGQVCSTMKDLHLFGVRYPAELIDAGHSQYVLRCVGACNEEESEDAAIARSMLRTCGISESSRSASASQENSEQRQEADGCLGGNSFDRRELRLLQLDLMRACAQIKGTGLPGKEKGDLLRRVLVLESQAEASGDFLCQKLALHARVMLLAMTGSCNEAYRLVLHARRLCEELSGNRSVVTLLLHLDCEALRAIVGDPQTDFGKRAASEARTLLPSLAVPIVAEEGILRADMASYLSGESADARNLNDHFSHAAACKKGRQGMYARFAAALCGMELGAKGSALVNLAEMGRIAAELGDLDMVGLAHVLSHVNEGPGKQAWGGESSLWRELSAISCEGLLGETKMSDDMKGLLRLYAALWEGSSADAAAASLMKVAVRPEVYAVAGLLCRADSVRGSALAAALPSLWKDRIEMSRMRRERGAEAPSAKEVLDCCAGLDRDGGPACGPLEIGVLGRLSVRKAGRLVPESAWKRSRARLLLTMLAISPSHELSRYAVADLFWPGSDYAKARESLYTVLSSLRSAIGQGREGPAYVRGGLGKIWLDQSQVKCDVDEFEALTRSVMSGKLSSASVMTACRRIEAMYGTGSVMPTVDPSGLFARRHKELSRRYVDALLVGVDSALSVGEMRQAIWFAQSASREAPMREDVAGSLVLALEADGRALEAHGAWASYEQVVEGRNESRGCGLEGREKAKMGHAEGRVSSIVTLR